MGISHSEYLEIQRRLERKPTVVHLTSCDRERELHADIINFCNSQWPRWKYRHARMDKATTEEEGVEDFTIFAPNGRTFHFECKASKAKLSDKQRDWRFEMARLGHEVHLIYSMSDFLDVIKPPGAVATSPTA